MLNLMNASKAEIAAADAAYRMGIVDEQARLRAHLHDTGGSEVDGQLGSLPALGAWFLRHIEAEPDSAVEERVPAWWDPDRPFADSGSEETGPFTGQQIRLIDEVHAYVADVLLIEICGRNGRSITTAKRSCETG